MQEYHHTLVASVGGQPQIITLTLDLLLRQSFPIDEVVVIHPAPVSEELRHTLACLDREFANSRYTCDGRTIDCRLQLHTLTHDNEPLSDITDATGAQATRDLVHRVIRQLKSQQRHVHLSASGGRRMISLMAISAALLHFDSFDHIWHIHTPDAILPLVHRGAQMHVAAEAGIRLIEVPLVPWGDYFPQLPRMASDSAQETLDAQTALLNAQEEERCREVAQKATPAQLKVLRALSEGYTPLQVAEQLGISRHTVYSHTKELGGLARNAWRLPEKEPVGAYFLAPKFAPYFRKLK